MYPSTSTQQPAAICALKSPADAIHILEAVRQGIVPRVTRRLTGHERQMIRPGTVWVWEEEETNMRRWTDGRRWGASRVGGGGFLVYTESSEGSPPPSRPDSPANNGYYPSSPRRSEPLVKQTYSTSMTHPVNSKAKKFHVVAYSSKHNPQGDGQNALPLPHQLPNLANVKITPGIWPDWETRRDDYNARRQGMAGGPAAGPSGTTAMPASAGGYPDPYRSGPGPVPGASPRDYPPPPPRGYPHDRYSSEYRDYPQEYRDYSAPPPPRDRDPRERDPRDVRPREYRDYGDYRYADRYPAYPPPGQASSSASGAPPPPGPSASSGSLPPQGGPGPQHYDRRYDQRDAPPPPPPHDPHGRYYPPSHHLRPEMYPPSSYPPPPQGAPGAGVRPHDRSSSDGRDSRVMTEPPHSHWSAPPHGSAPPPQRSRHSPDSAYGYHSDSGSRSGGAPPPPPGASGHPGGPASSDRREYAPAGERERHDIKFEPREVPPPLTVPGPGSAPASVVSSTSANNLGVDSASIRRSVTPSQRSPTNATGGSQAQGQGGVTLPPLRMAIGDGERRGSPRLSEGSNGGGNGKDAWGRVPA